MNTKNIICLIQDPPIGLAASTVEALQRHLEYVREQAQRDEGTTSSRAIYSNKASELGVSTDAKGAEGRSEIRGLVRE